MSRWVTQRCSASCRHCCTNRCRRCKCWIRNYYCIASDFWGTRRSSGFPDLQNSWFILFCFQSVVIIIAYYLIILSLSYLVFYLLLFIYLSCFFFNFQNWQTIAGRKMLNQYDNLSDSVHPSTGLPIQWKHLWIKFKFFCTIHDELMNNQSMNAVYMV